MASTLQLSRLLPCSSTSSKRSFSPCFTLAPSRRACIRAKAEEESKRVVYNKQFGYSRKDVILICVGILALGYALYYGLQATGVEAAMAGSFTQLILFIGLCVGWVGSYVYRVANKQMTYVQQLEQYEEAVMKKRLEELTEDELNRMLKEDERVAKDPK